MKKRTCMILALAVVFTMAFSGCAGYAGESPDQRPEMDYSVEVRDGKYYLVFDNVSKYVYSQDNGISGSGSGEIYFSSMQEFKDAVTKGELTTSDKRTIANYFPKDKTGAFLTPDFENLYVPTAPEGSAVRRVAWSGSAYVVCLVWDDGTQANFQKLTKEEYDNKFSSFYGNYDGNELVSVTSTVKLSDNKTATYYSTANGKFKEIHFSLNTDGKTIMVEKKYILSIAYSGFAASESIPQVVTLYCTEGNYWYFITVRNMTEDPTDEWLMEFGIEKFVDNGDAEK